MSIIIRKKETGEVFDVFPDFKLEIKNTSPFFNDLGSKTISTTLPRSSHNIRLLGFSHRLDVQNKPELKMSVFVSSGSYVRTGVLYEESAYNTENTFGITIAFDEGIMYESMSDILLTQLSNLPVLESSVGELYDMMNNLFTTDDLNKDMSVFYVDYKKQAYKENDDDENDQYWSEYVNGVKMQGLGNAKLAWREVTFAIESNKYVEISVPDGYGISPFLRVWYVLDLIFDHFGYTIGTNPFKEDFQLKRLCVLNNTVDAIVTGTLDYKQLLPPVSINDFLNALYCRFGLKVSFDSNTNTVNLSLLKDKFASKDMKRIDLSTEIDIDYTSPKQVKLSVAKSLDESDTSEDTYEEFLAKYNNTIGTIDSMLINVKAGGIYYDPRSGVFYKCSTNNQEKKRLSSIHFDWNKKDEGIDIEDITSTDEALTMSHQANASFAYLYYGIEAQLMNSILSIDGASQETDTANVLAFAYDMGEAYFNRESGKERIGHMYGSIFPYAWQSSEKLQEDANGNQFKYALTLTGEYGAFNQFFKEYDAFLRHANHTVKMKSYQNVFNLSAMDMLGIYNVQNQPLLLDKVDYDLDGSRGQNCEIEARTLRLLTPYDLDKEQAIPVPEDILYQWVLCSNQEKEINNRYKEILKQKTDLNNSDHIFNSLKMEITSDPNPPGDRTYWFLPPSERQFLKGDRTGTRKHSCEVKFTHKYMSNLGTSNSPRWETFEENSYETIPYESWFEAEKIE